MHKWMWVAVDQDTHHDVSIQSHTHALPLPTSNPYCCQQRLMAIAEARGNVGRAVAVRYHLLSVQEKVRVCICVCMRTYESGVVGSCNRGNCSVCVYIHVCLCPLTTHTYNTHL